MYYSTDWAVITKRFLNGLNRVGADSGAGDAAEPSHRRDITVIFATQLQALPLRPRSMRDGHAQGD
jgi:hypothetical protein